jgi:predicted RNase H-like HicB family nuclease
MEFAMRVIQRHTGNDMKQFLAVIEKCSDTGLYVGHVPGFPGAHSQGSTLDELKANMQEVIEMLLEDDVQPENEFVGTQLISVH